MKQWYALYVLLCSYSFVLIEVIVVKGMPFSHQNDPLWLLYVD